MSEKLISADKLIMTLESMRGSRTHATIDNIIYNLKIAPAVDAVEVVRCGECFYHKDSCFAGEGNIYCDVHMKYFPKDGFCSSGERREENEID